MSPGIFERFKSRGGPQQPRLKLEQSLGAFPKANGDVSPLYVLFGIFNTSEVPVVAEKVYLQAGRDTVLDLTTELGGDAGDNGGPPREIPPGEAATLWVRARDLSGKLQGRGHTGTPKLRLLVVDSGGGKHETTFKLRVDEYLQLKDE